MKTTICAAALALAFGLCQSASAETLDRRVRQIEKKTDHYEVKKMKRTRTFGGRVITRADVPTGRANFDDKFTIDANTPVVASIWIDITGSYTTSANDARMIVEVIGHSLLCFNEKALPAGSARNINRTVYCQAAVNAQEGEPVVVRIRFETSDPVNPNVTVNSLTYNAYFTNQVIVRPAL